MSITQLNVQTGEITYAEILPEEVPSPPTQAERLALLEAVYNKDREVLNLAWLSATIADGVYEEERKNALKVQMEELDAQYDIDFISILMEG